MAAAEPVNDAMFERNGIVSRRSLAWGKGEEFRVDSLPLTLSGATATFSVNDRYEITGRVARSVEPFGEREFGVLENELKLGSTTFILHAVRSDGFESYIFDSLGPYGRGVMNYFMQRRETPAMTVRISNDYGFPPPFWSSMEVADPVKGWVPWGWPGDDLPKGFAYYWTKDAPIRDGLWVVGYPTSWRASNPPKDLLWGPDGTGYGVNRFDIEGGKLCVYGLPTGYKLDDKKVLRRLKAWAELTGSTLSPFGRWEKATARGKTYDVYKTSATREGVERAVWHYRGPKPGEGDDVHTFLLECKPADAGARDAWLKLNEVPPPPMRRAPRI
ncbi:hypothetical protein EON79_11890 [bacterium]|nr:MAG: hypothetical protein EON79_11890 [bacterium]